MELEGGGGGGGGGGGKAAPFAPPPRGEAYASVSYQRGAGVLGFAVSQLIAGQTEWGTAGWAGEDEAHRARVAVNSLPDLVLLLVPVLVNLRLPVKIKIKQRDQSNKQEGRLSRDRQPVGVNR